MFNFLILLSFLIPVLSLSCTYQYNCQSVTLNYEFVQCVNNQCQCLPTFQGSATTSDPCRCGPDTQNTTYAVAWTLDPIVCKSCTYPRKFYYDNGVPYCVNLQESETQNNNYVNWLNMVNTLFVVYTNQTIAQAILDGKINVSQYFVPVPQMRAVPIGSFAYPNAIAEYYYGLMSTNPITKAVLRSWAVDTVGGGYNGSSVVNNGGQVCVKIDYYFDLPTLQGVAEYTGCIRINANNQIWSMDFIAPLFGKIFNPQIENPYSLDYLVNITCSRWFQYCVPLNFTDFPTFEDCRNFMYAVAPGETYDQMQGNNTICRQFHSNLLPSAPQIHCPHVSISGGMQCVDWSLSSYFDVDY